MTPEALKKAKDLELKKNYYETYLKAFDRDSIQIDISITDLSSTNVIEISTQSKVFVEQRPVIQSTLKHILSMLKNVIKEEIVQINKEFESL